RSPLIRISLVPESLISDITLASSINTVPILLCQISEPSSPDKAYTFPPVSPTRISEEDEPPISGISITVQGACAVLNVHLICPALLKPITSLNEPTLEPTAPPKSVEAHIYFNFC